MQETLFAICIIFVQFMPRENYYYVLSLKNILQQHNYLASVSSHKNKQGTGQKGRIIIIITVSSVQRRITSMIFGKAYLLVLCTQLCCNWNPKCSTIMHYYSCVDKNGVCVCDEKWNMIQRKVRKVCNSELSQRNHK